MCDSSDPAPQSLKVGSPLVGGEDFLGKGRIQILVDLLGMTMLVKNHNPEVVVVMRLAVELYSFAAELDASFETDNLMDKISHSFGIGRIRRTMRTHVGYRKCEVARHARPRMLGVGLQYNYVHL